MAARAVSACFWSTLVCKSLAVWWYCSNMRCTCALSSCETGRDTFFFFAIPCTAFLNNRVISNSLRTHCTPLPSIAQYPGDLAAISLPSAYIVLPRPRGWPQSYRTRPGPQSSAPTSARGETPAQTDAIAALLPSTTSPPTPLSGKTPAPPLVPSPHCISTSFPQSVAIVVHAPPAP